MMTQFHQLGKIYASHDKHFDAGASSLINYPQGADRHVVVLYANDPAETADPYRIEVGISNTLRYCEPFSTLTDEQIWKILSGVGMKRLDQVVRENSATRRLEGIVLLTNNWEEFVEESPKGLSIKLGPNSRYADRQLLKRRMVHLLWEDGFSRNIDQLAETVGVERRFLMTQLAQLREAGFVHQTGDDWSISARGELICTAGRLDDVFPDLPKDRPLDFEVSRDGGITTKDNSREWDVFISHASEDKQEIARPLAEELRRRGLSVWFDEFELRIGDSLRRKIDEGLSRSRFGIVIFSHSFFAKNWPQSELDGLFAREMARSGEGIILPVWHRLTAEEMASYSPLMKDRFAAFTDIGVVDLAQRLYERILA